MKFSLGIPTLIEMPDFQDTVALATKLKVDFIELNMNMPEFCPESLSPQKIRKVTEEKGIEFYSDVNSVAGLFNTTLIVARSEMPSRLGVNSLGYTVNIVICGVIFSPPLMVN